MMTFDPAKIAEQHRLYKQQQAERIAETAKLQAEREARAAEIQAAIAKKCKPRCLRKPQRCFHCGGTIAAGEMGKPESVSVGYGAAEGTHWKTQYRHFPSCPTSEEAKQ